MFCQIKINPHLEQSSRSIRHKNGFYEVYASDSVCAKLRIRPDYPTTYCTQQPSGIVDMGYGQASTTIRDEFLHIALSPDGAVRIERDVLCTLPLFYAYDGETFIVSNDFHDACSALRTLTLNYEHIGYTLHRFLDTPTTLFKEVRVLAEREVLVFAEGTVTVRKAEQPVPPPESADARQFSRILHQSMDRFYKTRLTDTAFAMEVSGGLDSSLLPLYLGQTRALPDLIGYSFIMDDAQRERQIQKIEAIQAAARISVLPIFLDAQHDLMPRLTADNDRMYIHSGHHIYGETYNPALAKMHERGVRTIVTGLGGDQLFEHIPDRQRFDFNSVATELRAPFAGTRVISPDLNPRPTLLSSNTAYEYVDRTNKYLEYDMWPVSPFNDVALAHYVRTLPVQHRDNKNILRAYYQASQFPTELYLGDNEHFHTYFSELMTKEHTALLIKDAINHSITDRLGIADMPTLAAMYTHLQTAGPDPNGQLYLIYQWLNIEKNISLALNNNVLVP